MQILIIGGFLGSGKTSILAQLAKYVIGNDPAQKPKVAILENEIGEVGVDDVILSSTGLTIKNLFAGCICCSISGELVPTLRQLQNEFDPELAIIEATGIACPKSIKDTLLTVFKDTDIRICTIVDAKRWDGIKKPLWDLIERQLEDGNTFLVNKIDLVDADVPERIISELKEFLSSPASAEYFSVSANEQISPEIWDYVLGKEN